MNTSKVTPDRTADFFHGYAGGFNAIYGNTNNWFNTAINTAFRGAMRERFERSVAGCSPTIGATILDVGCGPGHYGVALAQRGAKEVVGIDFAPGMLATAKANATKAGVEDKCSFIQGDFVAHAFDRTFDFSIYTGFMDYMRDPVAVVRKAASLTTKKAFFSFPSDEGFLAWQRKMRYKLRCDLYLYSQRHVEAIMQHTGKPFVVENIGRDYFVTLMMGS
ncbi:MAG: class I SAM-dependent methyltransferase [Polyangiaceae bacterium]